MIKPHDTIHYVTVRQGSPSILGAWLLTTFDGTQEAVIIRIDVEPKWSGTFGWEYCQESCLSSYDITPPEWEESGEVFDITTIQFPLLKGYKIVGNQIDGDGHILSFLKV